MDNVLDKIIDPHLVLSVPVAMFVILVRVPPLGELWKNEIDRKWWIGLLIQNGWKSRYRRVMRGWLDALDQRLSAPEIEAERGQAAIAWSVTLLQILMLLAVAYPILSFVAQWIAGSPLRFGGETLVEGGNLGARAFTVFWFGGAGLMACFALAARPPRRAALFMAAAVVLLGGVFLSARFEVPQDVATALEIAFAASVGFAAAYSFATKTAATAIVAFLAAAAAATATAAGVATLTAFAATVATGATFAATVAFARLEDRLPGQGIWLGYLLLLFVAITLSVSVFWLPEVAPIRAAYVVVFVGVFPILNVLADFASVGLTRFLLRRGLDRRTWAKSLLDLAGGVAIFALLGITTISYLHWVRTPDGQPLLDLAGLFADLESNPGDMWWLAFMLGSTLIPTALHAMVGTLTILIAYPEWLRKWVVAKLESGGKGSDTDGWLGSMAVCAMIVTSIWVPCLLLYWIATANHGWLLQQVIAGFKAYATWIGAI